MTGVIVHDHFLEIVISFIGHPFVQYGTSGSTKERVVLDLRDVQDDDQILRRTADPRCLKIKCYRKIYV